jgi:hypothetical protein
MSIVVFNINMTLENRVEPRLQVKLPLRLANGEIGITRDVSNSGLFFEMEGDYSLDEEIDLSVGLNVHGRPVWLDSHYRVMRIERHNGRTGVAVKLLASRHGSPLAHIGRPMY